MTSQIRQLPWYAVTFAVAVGTSTAIAHADPTAVTFRSPSGNVVCALHAGLMNPDAAGAACDVARHDYPTPPGAVGCEHGGGLRFIVAAGDPAQVDCHLDTLRAAGMRTLGYGDSVGLGTVTCRSAEAYVACTDGSTGHGFTVSVQRYQLI